MVDRIGRQFWQIVTLETRLARLRYFCYTFIANVGERHRSN